MTPELATVPRGDAAPSLATPAAFEAFQRRLGGYIRTNVIRGDDDKIDHVEVEFLYRDQGHVITFFPTKEKCAADLENKLNTGELHNPKELEWTIIQKSQHSQRIGTSSRAFQKAARGV